MCAAFCDSAAATVLFINVVCNVVFLPNMARKVVLQLSSKGAD